MKNDRELPQSLEHEKAALGSVFIKPIALSEIGAVLQVDDFMLPVHREIFESMVAVTARRQPVDPLSVADELKARGMLKRLDGGLIYLNQLAEAVPTAENAAHYARVVREKATLRRLIVAAADVGSRAYADHGDHEEFVAGAVKQVSDAAMSGSSAKSETIADIVGRVLDDAERSQNGEVVRRVPTGIAPLDSLLRGGLSPEHLIVPCGLTSMGKSSWAFQVAFRGAVERQVPALIFTLEMSKAEVVIKGAANAYRIESDQFTPQKGDRVDWRAVNMAMGKLASLGDMVRIEECREIEKIVAVSRTWRAAHPDDQALIVVDLIGKVRVPREKNGNREQEVASVARALKDLAKDLKCPVVAPCQLNNEAAKEKRAPTIGDMRESKAIEHEADVIIGIHRDRMPKRTAGGMLNYNAKAELHVLKHRGGRTGKKTVRWRGDIQSFEELTGDEDDDGEEAA